MDGKGAPADAFERAVADLAVKSVVAPALLGPRDLEPLRACVGEGAVDYALVLGAFHFINRIADLLHVDSEALPEGARRFEPLRRIGVRMAARLLSRVDLVNRRGLDRDRRVAEVLRLAVEERDQRSKLARDLIARVQHGVEASLPSCREEAEGFHARPADPVDAFAFVGTRYAARTTEAMIAALKERGFDELAILDLAIAVADANQWARTHRLLGLSAGRFYLDAEGGAAALSAGR